MKRLTLALVAAVVLPAAGAASDPLRLPLEIRGNNPVTTIEVAGHEIQVGIDTGGGKLGLTPAALELAGAVELGGEPQSWTDSNGKVHTARRYRVPQVRIGGQAFAGLEAIEAEEIPNGPAVANVIGREFLRQFIAIIDYPRHMMTLLPFGTPVAQLNGQGCKDTRVRFEKTGEPGLVITKVKLDGADLRLGWDTGAQYSALRASAVEALRLPVTPANGEKPAFYDAKRVAVGGADLGPLDFVVLPLGLPDEMDGVLGYNLFAGHVVCLDYLRGELRVHSRGPAE